ncbi:MAG: bacteriocin [Bacteroidaceae bacterium]|nr:bacteriocin [Bacteroidaceae bacterium]
MEKQKDKRVLHIALDDDVKKVSITGKDGDEKVVMRQELSEDELDNVTGGYDIKTIKRCDPVT